MQNKIKGSKTFWLMDVASLLFLIRLTPYGKGYWWSFGDFLHDLNFHVSWHFPITCIVSNSITPATSAFVLRKNYPPFVPLALASRFSGGCGCINHEWGSAHGERAGSSRDFWSWSSCGWVKGGDSTRGDNNILVLVLVLVLNTVMVKDGIGTLPFSLSDSSRL